MMVAERAGVSIGTLYPYVSGIDELIAGLVEAHLEAETRALATVLAEADTVALARIADVWSRNYRYWRGTRAFVAPHLEHPDGGRGRSGR